MFFLKKCDFKSSEDKLLSLLSRPLQSEPDNTAIFCRLGLKSMPSVEVFEEKIKG
jgi:hypothetical protein